MSKTGWKLILVLVWLLLSAGVGVVFAQDSGEEVLPSSQAPASEEMTGTGEEAVPEEVLPSSQAPASEEMTGTGEEAVPAELDQQAFQPGDLEPKETLQPEDQPPERFEETEAQPPDTEEPVGPETAEEAPPPGEGLKETQQPIQAEEDPIPASAQQPSEAAPQQQAGKQVPPVLPLTGVPIQKAPVAAPVRSKPLAKNEIWERGALEFLMPEEPPRVRIVILDGSRRRNQASMVSVLLNKFRNQELEKKIGKKITVVNYSNIPVGKKKKSIIYYHPGFMRAAMLVAEVIPGAQTVAPMPLEGSNRIGIDLEIWISGELY